VFISLCSWQAVLDSVRKGKHDLRKCLFPSEKRVGEVLLSLRTRRAIVLLSPDQEWDAKYSISLCALMLVSASTLPMY